ncbi:hypothetical protein ACFQ1S_06155 [Kibdelosporangium lantanae]|uniref:Barstar (Barnase inhibitor) n=1 Tax=Kibdelosporangium lantanae TaxID=1497396 RepID=A0ABW3M3M4_9PSEU
MGDPVGEREFFELVRLRPGMYVERPGFLTLAVYVEGYMGHAGRHGDSVFAGWRGWLADRLGHSHNLAWPLLVVRIAFPGSVGGPWDLAPEDDAKAVETMFSLLDEFLTERET